MSAPKFPFLFRDVLQCGSCQTGAIQMLQKTSFCYMYIGFGRSREGYPLNTYALYVFDFDSI